MELTMLLNKRRLVFDGGTGSSLVAKGLKPGEMPETWNLLKPEEIEGLHLAYIEAGADIIKTNTFGAYSFKLGDRQKETVEAALDCAERAIRKSGREVLTALDVGPLGKLLEPFGEISFDEAVGYFKELITIGKDRADLILIETMNDLYEIKAAVVAAKECSDLPIAVTVALDERGRLLTGADVETVVTFLEGIGVTALGVNCGFGPKAVKPFVEKMVALATVPVIANPNAGLPQQINGRAVYSLTAEDYAAEIGAILAAGASLVGGCCGTTPAHIGAIADAVKSEAPLCPKPVCRTALTSFRKTVTLSEDAVLLGARLDPAYAPAMAEYLEEGDTDAIVDECLDEACEVDVISLSALHDGVSEKTVLPALIPAIQEMTDLPLMLKVKSTEALRTALRLYNGKAMVMPLGSLAEAFPVIAEYGAVAVIPSDDREEVLTLAARCGIRKEDLVFLSASGEAGLSLIPEEGEDTLFSMTLLPA